MDPQGVSLEELVTRGLAGHPIDAADALNVLRWPDDGLLDLIAAVSRVRRQHFGNRIKLNYLLNLKSGLCSEDCGYCSQRRDSQAEVLKYSWVAAEAAAEAAAAAAAAGAQRMCLVASGRGPSDKDISRVTEIVDAIRGAAPEAEICACLGLLEPGQAESLRKGGVDAYNHNLNTSEAHYQTVCQTHSHQDRVDTLSAAMQAGLSGCSGAVFGMGEGDGDVVDVAFRLRTAGPDSVPVNFLMPFTGTPLQGLTELTPQRCLKILAMFRLVFPDTELRLGAGREMHLRGLQGLALHVVDSIFLGDYLTSEGSPAADDLALIADVGLVPLGLAQETGGQASQTRVRKRGLGTDRPGNA